jgi:hypothetical protein
MTGRGKMRKRKDKEKGRGKEGGQRGERERK